MFRKLLELVIGVDSDPGKRGLEKFKGDVSRFKTSVAMDLKKAFAPVAQFATLAGAGAVFANFGRKAFDMAEAVKNAREEIGLSSEFLQQWIGVAKRFNIDQEASIDLLKEFTQRVGEAREEEGELNEMLKRYGVSVRDANGEMKSARELLGEVSELMRNAGDEAERLFIADQAFGSGGNGVNRFLQDGRENLEKMLEQSKRMDDEVIDRLANAKQAWNELGTEITIATGNLISFLGKLAKPGGKRDDFFLFRGLPGANLPTPAELEEPEETTPERSAEDEAAAKKKQADRLEEFRAQEEREAAMKRLEALEKKLAEAKERNRLKEMDTAERIVELEEKRAGLLEGNKGETEAEIEKLIEAERIRAELTGLRDRLEAENKKSGSKKDPLNQFAVSSLAAIGGGGLVGPSSTGETAALSESRRQTELLREVSATLKDIERKESNGGFELK